MNEMGGPEVKIDIAELMSVSQTSQPPPCGVCCSGVWNSMTVLPHVVLLVSACVAVGYLTATVHMVIKNKYWGRDVIYSSKPLFSYKTRYGVWCMVVCYRSNTQVFHI